MVLVGSITCLDINISINSGITLHVRNIEQPSATINLKKNKTYKRVATCSETKWDECSQNYMTGEAEREQWTCPRINGKVRNKGMSWQNSVSSHFTGAKTRRAFIYRFRQKEKLVVQITKSQRNVWNLNISNSLKSCFLICTQDQTCSRLNHNWGCRYLADAQLPHRCGSGSYSCHTYTVKLYNWHQHVSRKHRCAIPRSSFKQK